jgi:hypothetical protein
VFPQQQYNRSYSVPTMTRTERCSTVMKCVHFSKQLFFFKPHTFIQILTVAKLKKPHITESDISLNICHIAKRSVKQALDLDAVQQYQCLVQDMLPFLVNRLAQGS